MKSIHTLRWFPLPSQCAGSVDPRPRFNPQFSLFVLIMIPLMLRRILLFSACFRDFTASLPPYPCYSRRCSTLCLKPLVEHIHQPY
ncbi:unnamed protein product [Protopolystoma xenopodis]|uniref:Uncharacterized protein n=1 Tax=Protopolystoma xenopodis TaxID=117903 RepID=A0A3S5CF02_9PLAT|nr:unnamed protein product [Protopolystoma xenopodis]